MINILRCYTGRLHVTPVTTIFRRPYMKVSNKMETLLKQADQIPRHFELIYRYPTYRMAGFMFHTVNWFSFTTFTIVAYEYYMDRPLKNVEDDEKLPKFITNPTQAVIAGCFTALILFVTWTMRGRSPMRVYYNPDSGAYRAIFLGKLPYSAEHYEFRKGGMNYVSQNSIFPWRTTLLQANGRKIFLYEDYFRTAGDFVNMFKTEQK